MPEFATIMASKYCIFSQLVRRVLLLYRVTSLPLTRALRAVEWLSFLLRVTTHVYVLSAQLDSKLVEERVIFSCSPCGTNSAQRALRPHPISSC